MSGWGRLNSVSTAQVPDPTESVRHQLRPLFDQIVIKELDSDRVRRSGLVVPPGSHEPPPQQGIVLATLAAQRTDNKLADGAGQLAALNSGYHLAYVIGAILVAAAVVIAFTVLREVPMPSPEQMAEHAHGAEPEAEPAYSEA